MRLSDVMRMKTAEVSGTRLAPTSPSAIPTDPARRTTTLNKAAGIGHLVHQSQHPHGELPAGALPKNESLPTKGIESLPQAKIPAPYVSTTVDKVLPQEKRATITALRGKYPLDSVEHVKQASAYFEQYYNHFVPEDRREFAVNMVKRAEFLGVPCGPRARRYAGTTYGSDDQIKEALDLRALLLRDDPQRQATLETLNEKRASLSPEFFCEVLAEFDRRTGIEEHYNRVPDPYYSTYGDKLAAEETQLFGVGNEQATLQELRELGIRGRHRLVELFGEDFAKEFRKDPAGIFNSMPVEEKKLIVRAAVQAASGAQNG